jgi:hypothetical protein
MGGRRPRLARRTRTSRPRLAATTRIAVGIGIMPAGARNVCFAAMEPATLAQLYPGRLIAGIGHGMPDGCVRPEPGPPAPGRPLRG